MSATPVPVGRSVIGAACANSRYPLVLAELDRRGAQAAQRVAGVQGVPKAKEKPGDLRDGRRAREYGS